MPAACCPQTIAAKTQSLFDELKQHQANANTLAPGPVTNRLFGDLVSLSLQPVPLPAAEQAMASLGNILDELYALCATGEYAMEKHWGERIRTAAQPLDELRQFPYWQNYLKLTRLEVAALRRENPNMRRVLFVGAGPLPLTAYIMAKHYKLDVTNLDIDGDATCCAAAWMERILGVGTLPCLHTDVMHYTDFAGYDAVVMAALVGLDIGTKQRVLAHLHQHMSPQQTLLVRSARGLRSLLYPPVAASDLTGFDVTRTIHPRGEVVNSVLLARKTA